MTDCPSTTPTNTAVRIQTTVIFDLLVFDPFFGPCFANPMSSSTSDNDNLAWVKPMFRAAFDESHAGGKSATGHSPAVAAVKVLTHVIKTSRGERIELRRVGLSSFFFF